MKREKVLVRDDNKGFLKIFKRELLSEFQFTETSLITNNETESMNFDRFIYVVYNKSELIQFLNVEKTGLNVLICLFNEQLCRNIPFLEEIYDLILLDGYKTKREIITDLKLYFKNTSDSNFIKSDFPSSDENRNQSHNVFKSLLLFV